MTIVLNERTAILQFAHHLRQESTPYVWLHSYHKDELGDVDIAVDKRSFSLIENIVQAFAIRNDFKIIQLLQHEYCAKYFVLFRQRTVLTEYLILDICSDYVRNGRMLIRCEELLNERIHQEDFETCSIENEALYVFLKTTLKGTWSDNRIDDFNYLYRQNTSGVVERLTSYCDSPLIDRFFKFVTTRDLANLVKDTPRIARSILRNRLIHTLGSTTHYFAGNLGRIVGRIVHPTGLFVCFVGPDGSGKSALMENTVGIVGRAFRKIKKHHWRPNIFGKNQESTIVTDPHGQEPRGFLLSILKVLFYLADYIIGYYFVTIPAKMRSTFIVYDRYYYDLFVDPRRFRLSIHTAILRAMQLLIPKPDLVFFVNSDVNQIAKRKPELPAHELERQQLAFRGLRQSLGARFIIIENTGPLEESTRQVSSHILEYLSARIRNA